MKRKAAVWLMLAALLIPLFPAGALAKAPVKNVIIVMPDGMSATHATVARWYNGGKALVSDEMICGAIRTYSAESLISDSAPASTAFATGHKSNSKFIGILPAKTTMPGVAPVADELKYKPGATVLEGAKLQGKAVGLVATSNIQHASPAGYSAHTFNRNDYNDIAEQQVYLDIDVVFGGGKQYLLPVAQGGKRTDGENLVAVLKDRGYRFVEDRGQMASVKSGKVWGMFAMDDMAYEFDRPTFRPEEPSLAEMTGKAIELLSQNKNGFFLFVEASKVDWASHANDPIGVISDVLAFDEAMKVALDFARKDGQTLVLGFTDHGNGGMSIGNKTTDATYDKLPFEALIAPLKKATLTGEGIEKVLDGDLSESNIRFVMSNYYGVDDLTAGEVTAIQKAKKGSMNYAVGPVISRRSVIGWTTNGHTGEDVFLYAYGPNRPTGLIQNTDLALAQAGALGLDLDAVDGKLFVEADKAFAAIGATVRLDKADAANPVLVVEKGMKRVELPISKDIVRAGGTSCEMHGLTVLAAKTGKVYVPRQAVELAVAAGL
ncbi:alkaline phosphatase [Anaeroselena agilis]|uniref:Alkaline phosphatase n=1 Tax=Anaeroselena agilis TaxID=3063788 RepID=A0ABU3P290_9FIRM|nr:alkaline phosphatase [Selenomonadales bacterium 4137-cl]